MPVAKREKALAMIEHLTSATQATSFSRLSLAVVGGTLQSFVEATPRRRGQTFLKRLHALIRPSGMGSGMEPYCTCTRIPQRIRKDLEWWGHYLRSNQGRYARTQRSATLIPTFGDGSGTGTGGTFKVPDRPLKMWQGVWTLGVFHFSSNWKELATLLLTMRALKNEHEKSLSGTTVFYFTDNSTTYWIANAGASPDHRLHGLIEEIKQIEVDMDLVLQVVHVPGLVMIQQGTDGLSRGIWMSPLHEQLPQHIITRSIFDPLPYDPQLVHDYWSTIPGLPPWTFYAWDQQWDARLCFGRTTVWFPPPELARQCIYFLLETWCERPLDTAAIFFVPRTVPAFWWGLSKYIIELPTLYPHLTPLRKPSILPIPVTVLLIPCHQRVLPNLSNRLERTTDPANVKWHREQAAYMHGLQPIHIPE